MLGKSCSWLSNLTSQHLTSFSVRSVQDPLMSFTHQYSILPIRLTLGGPHHLPDLEATLFQIILSSPISPGWQNPRVLHLPEATFFHPLPQPHFSSWVLALSAGTSWTISSHTPVYPHLCPTSLAWASREGTRKGLHSSCHLSQ
jgi:hypothetical protein